MFDKRLSTKLIEKYLERHGWHAHMAIDQPTGGFVVTGWKGSSGDLVGLQIEIRNDKNAVLFYVPAVVTAKPDETPADRLSGLLVLLGYMNYRIILGKWCYDPTDGEVAFRLGIPIEGNELSYEQFEHCLLVTAASAEVEGERLRCVLAGTKTVGELLRQEGAQVP